jgi:hypothetical protein
MVDADLGVAADRRHPRPCCDGCEIGTLELVIGKHLLQTIKGLSNLKSLQLRDTKIGGRPAVEVRAQLAGGTSYDLSGIELSPGTLTGYLLEYSEEDVFALAPSDGPMAQDARQVLASLRVR